MSIDTSKSIKQVTYNGTVIPLVGSGEDTTNYFWVKPLLSGLVKILPTGITVGIRMADSYWMYYSFDKETWYNYDFTNYLSVNANQKVYFKGPSAYLTMNGLKYTYIDCQTSGGVQIEFDVGGDIMSLIDEKSICKTRYCFAWIFYGTQVRDASELNLNPYGLTNCCFDGIFWGCSHLIAPPRIDYKEYITTEYTTSLAPFNRAFLNCTSLYVSETPISGVAEKVWTIPAPQTTLSSPVTQPSMFDGCLGTRSSSGVLLGVNELTFYVNGTN